MACSVEKPDMYDDHHVMCDDPEHDLAVTSFVIRTIVPPGVVQLIMNARPPPRNS